MSASGGGSKRPTYTRPGGDFLGSGQYPFGGDAASTAGLPGYFGDVGAQGMYPVQQLFGGFGNLLNAANAGGTGLRDLASQASNQAYGNQMGLANQAYGAAGQSQDLSQLAPQFMGAAQQFAQGINSAQSQFGKAYGAAGQTLQNVMNPTAYNPIYQNAINNQLNPQINSAYAARGLATSGPAAEALSAGARDLSNQFAQRQFGEQLQAQQGLGQLAQGGGNLASQASLLPGQIFNQFQQGYGQGLQNTGYAQQAQLGPLQGLGLGGSVFQQGLDMPFKTAQGIYDTTRAPLQAFGSFINGVPNITGGNRGFLSSLFS